MRLDAAKRIGGLLHEHAGKLLEDEDWQMDVTNETGLILFVINVTGIMSSATTDFPKPVTFSESI
jgi:hypothetical protein